MGGIAEEVLGREEIGLSPLVFNTNDGVGLLIMGDIKNPKNLAKKIGEKEYKADEEDFFEMRGSATTKKKD